MCPVFFCADFWDGRGEGADAVGGFGCGVRRNWSQRQNIFSNFGDFVLLLSPREPDLESAVEHFFNFWRFCSTFGAARAGFGVGGRTFFQILENLFYFEARGRQNWSRE